MARIVVIGGSGHVGTYLIPMLVDLGHQVVNVSRGNAKPYSPHYAWSHIENIQIDRQKEEEKGSFGDKIVALKPDIVIDMIAFNLSSTCQIVQALKGKVEHYIFCSTIWVYGNYISIPSKETDSVNPIDDYGRGKAESELWLMREARISGFPVTCFRPGHIVGKGWVPTNPQGNSNPDVYSLIAQGRELSLPNLGHETLHHVHAIDVARFIVLAIENRSASIGEIFNVVSEQAITLRGFAEAVYRWFEKKPNITYKPFELWLQALDMSKEYIENSYGHIIRSSSHSIEKAVKRLGYHPCYSSLDAIYESVMALAADRKIHID